MSKTALQGLPAIIGALALMLASCGPPAAPPVLTSTPARAVPPTWTSSPSPTAAKTATPMPTRRPTVAPPPTPTPTPSLTPIPPEPSAPDVTPDLALVAAVYPRVDGSTSALPLQRTIACTVFGVACRWWKAEDLLLTPERTVLPDLEQLESSPWAEIVMQIGHSGTHGSYVNLIEEEADFILVARAPSEDELALAREHGVELDVRAVALDAFVFLAHVENPVDDLSMEAIRAIYTGEIARWEQVGGGAGEIHTYKRNPDSGSQVLMETLVMRGTPMVDSPYMMVESMIGPLNMIGGNPGPGKEESGDPLGIGYSVYYYVTAILPHERVKLLGVDGVQPTAEHIASRAYPLTTEVYAAVRADALPGSGAVLLRDWLLTEEGQAVVAESGYVAIR